MISKLPEVYMANADKKCDCVIGDYILIRGKNSNMAKKSNYTPKLLLYITSWHINEAILLFKKNNMSRGGKVMNCALRQYENLQFYFVFTPITPTHGKLPATSC